MSAALLHLIVLKVGADLGVSRFLGAWLPDPRTSLRRKSRVACWNPGNGLIRTRKSVLRITVLLSKLRVCALRAERHYVFVLFYCFYRLECHSRSQWSSGSMSDCSARGPGIESRCGQMCLSHNHCDLQPWARALYTLPAVPRSTQPSSYVGW